MSKDIHASREKRRLHLLGQIGDLARVQQQATDLFDERIGDFLGVNRTDGRCLDIIARAGRISAGQLAIQSGLTTGAVTAVIDRVETAGYVARVRDPLDRRKVWVEGTPHLHELVEIIFGVYDLLGPLMMRHFTLEQLEGIMAFLRIGSRINQELAAGLKENTEANAAPDQRIAQARLFRRAVDALTPRLAADFDEIAPGKGDD